MTLERELKLQAPATFRMPELADTGRVVVAREPQQLVTTYVDTPDLRIVRWGCSLRHRRGGAEANGRGDGWTLKLPPTEEGSLLVRVEHVFEGDDPRKLPVAAAELVRAYVRNGELAPVVRLRTVRRGVQMTDEIERPLALVTDDEVSVMDGRRVASRFRELEVELDPSTPSEVAEDILARLRDAGAGPVDNVPKIVRALGARAKEPPDVVVPDLEGDSSVAVVVRGAIAASVVRLLTHDAGVRLGEDPEAVHQARVAIRRLRSDLRTFRDVVEPAWSTPLRHELKWLGSLLGAVRDAEVLRDRLRAREALLADADRRALRRFLSELERKRAKAREKLLSAMREPRYVSLLDALVEAAQTPAVREEVAATPAGSALRDTLEAPWKHMRTAIEHVRQDETDETLHAARIRAKRVRYGAEAVAPVFGKRARAFAKAAEALQNVLGEHQDAVVASAWLREAAKASSAQSFVAGQLVAFEAEAGRAARAAWPDAWKAFSRKKLRFWS
jgi:CHAD domain-containing protein